MTGEKVESNRGEHVIVDGEDVSNHIVSVRDDGDSPITVRSVVLAILGSGFNATMNQIYQFKPTEVSISGTFLVLIIWIAGTAWHSALPTKRSLEKRWKSVKDGQESEIGPFKKRLITIFDWLNPGPFGLKEHCVAAITASSASNGAAAVQIFAVQKLFYLGNPLTAVTAILGTLSIGLFGYGLAGLLRPISVYPAEAVYWATLPTVGLFQALHWEKTQSSKKLKAFWWSIGGMSVYEFFPAYIFPTLNSISIPCLASRSAPQKSKKDLNNFFGGSLSNQGLGILSLSFDWQYITSTFVSYPFKQQLNSWVGILLCYVIFAGVYYNNVWNAKSFPFLSTSLFRENGTRYSQNSVFINGILDQDAIERQGSPHLAATYAWSLVRSNLSIGALFLHVILFWGKDILKGIKQIKNKNLPDRHWVAMQKYSEVSWTWYAGLMLLAFVFGLVVTCIGHTTLPIYGYIMALVVGVIIAPFSTVLYSLMGNGIATNSICKLIGGILVPGRPLANLYFFGFSHSTIMQCINLSNDLKMGQYLKIPPRVLFLTQVGGTVLGAFINYAVMTSIVSQKRDLLLSNNGSYAWSGQTFQALNVQAITWSLSKYLYSRKGPYFLIPMALVIGAACVIVHRIFHHFVPRLGPLSTDKINLPIIFMYSGWLASGQSCIILSQILVGVFSQWFLRTRYPKLFKEYNYIIGAALDGGSLLVMFILSFAVFGAAGDQHAFPTWWGNPEGYPDHCPKA
ncbi:OPT superfamily oligopeptide transporter [Violaceomyces palustris]|uniref:OPT superfamily oligopeptide transporter n=1 Tax=Violaceomyces palustris TaxID=1673888 RepID=A0ACD0P7K1_9BASI|nr:OPT superfamily oligopeptide transporter [Violaceomyces palustris]